MLFAKPFFDESLLPFEGFTLTNKSTDIRELRRELCVYLERRASLSKKVYNFLSGEANPAKEMRATRIQSPKVFFHS